MDKFWERYIQSRPAPGTSKGAFEAFAAASREPRTMAQEPRNMYAGGQLVQNTVDGSRPGYKGKSGAGLSLDRLSEYKSAEKFYTRVNQDFKLVKFKKI